MVRIKLFFVFCFFCVLSFSFAEDVENFSSDNFTISEKNHQNLVYTYVLDDSLIRKEYDLNKCLLLKITWDINTEKMISKTSYAYSESSMFPLSSETVYFLESKTEKREFSDAGKEVLCQTYLEKKLVLEQKYVYDSEGRISKNIEKKYEFLENELKSITENEIRYEYVEFDSESKTFTNEFYFENQFKTKEKIYLSPLKFYENTFFEGDIRIYTEYEENQKKLEITYFQGKELRRK